MMKDQTLINQAQLTGPEDDRNAESDKQPEENPTATAPGLEAQLEQWIEAIRGFVARRISNRDDAEDVAQQALLIAYRSLDTFRNGNLRRWLFTIASHLIVDHYRASARSRAVDVDEPASACTERALQVDAESVPEACENRALLRCYVGCLARRLSEDHEVAMLLDICGYRDKEAAGALGMTLPSFKLLLHKARTSLRDSVGRECPLVNRAGPVACAQCAALTCVDEAPLGGEPLPRNGSSGRKPESFRELRQELRAVLLP